MCAISHLAGSTNTELHINLLRSANKSQPIATCLEQAVNNLHEA